MKESWSKNSNGARMGASAWQTLDDLRKQFTRNVDMRMKRGDVRAAIIRLLAESPMHGYQIIHEIQTRSGGAWKPSAGSVYPTLQLLADEGLIVSKEAAGRRTYSLTKTGQEVADVESATTAPWVTGSDRESGPRGALAMAGIALARAAADVARKAKDDKIHEATAVLDEAAKKLKAMLAQD
jgi:DNA-binding PadR family transcriptional regulator